MTLIKSAIQVCAQEDLSRCDEWSKLRASLTRDIRGMVIGVELTVLPIKEWVEEALTMLQNHSPAAQSISAEVLLIISKRLKYRVHFFREHISNRLIHLINMEQDPLISSRLLAVLNELLPLGEGSIFYTYVEQDWPDEVQSAAWRVIASRHSNVERVSMKSLSRMMSQVSSRSVKASMIMAAIDLRSAKVIRWCGEEWWRTELFESCREALSYLESERAARSLWRWVKSLFSDMDQALNADQKIAEGLVYLSRATRTGQAERRYQKLLDRFFARRRSETAAMAVANSWLDLPSKRFAIELSLKYLRAKSSKIVSQSHFFEQHLRKIIYLLSTPTLDQDD